jgi:hypothetical protein
MKKMHCGTSPSYTKVPGIAVSRQLLLGVALHLQTLHPRALLSCAIDLENKKRNKKRKRKKQKKEKKETKKQTSLP